MTEEAGEIEGGAGEAVEVVEQGGRDFEAEARAQGWKPVEEFKGDPSTHKSAEEFVKAAEEKIPLLNARNKHLQTSLEASQRRYTRLEKDFAQLRSMMGSMEKRVYDRAYAELTAKQRAAVESGDVQAHDAIGKEIEALREDMAPVDTPKNGTKYEPREVQRLYADFVSNEWFDETAGGGPKKAMTIYAGTVADELGLIDDYAGTPEEYFAEIVGRVKDKYGEKYPEMFGEAKPVDDDEEDEPKPRRKSAVEGVSAGRGRTTPKTAAHLSAEERAQGKRFVDMGIFPNIEAYAKEFHANV